MGQDLLHQFLLRSVLTLNFFEPDPQFGGDIVWFVTRHFLKAHFFDPRLRLGVRFHVDEVGHYAILVGRSGRSFVYRLRAINQEPVPVLVAFDQLAGKLEIILSTARYWLHVERDPLCEVPTDLGQGARLVPWR